MNDAQRFPKKELYTDGSFSIHSYDFVIGNGPNAGKTVHLMELRTMKKRWSEECNSYFDQKHYITITLTQFLGLYKAMKANVAQLGELDTPEL